MLRIYVFPKNHLLSLWVRYVESKLAQLGEQIYERNREEWEKTFPGKIIAIETESEQMAGIGENVDDAYREALKKYPGRQFYFRRVGEERAAGYLFTVDGT